MTPADGPGGELLAARHHARDDIGTGGAGRPPTGRSRRRYCTTSSKCLDRRSGGPRDRQRGERASARGRELEPNRPSLPSPRTASASARSRRLHSSRAPAPQMEWRKTTRMPRKTMPLQLAGPTRRPRFPNSFELSPVGIPASSAGLMLLIGLGTSIPVEDGARDAPSYRVFPDGQLASGDRPRLRKARVNPPAMEHEAGGKERG